MYPYLLMIGLPSVLGLATKRNTQITIGLLLVFILFLGVIGLRYDIGPDWFAYTMQAQRLPNENFDALRAEGEYGWSALVILLDAMGLGIQGLAFVAGVAFVGGLCMLARSCEEPMLAIVAAVPYLSIAVAMSGMRQAMAIGIIFALVSVWYRVSVFTRVGIVLFASLFHFSALGILLVVAMEVRMKLFPRILAGTTILGLMIYLVGTNEYRVARYTEAYSAGGGAADASGALFHVALTAIPCIIYFMLRKRWIEVYGRIPLVDILGIIGIAALFAVFIAPTATDRMTLNFSAVGLIIQSGLPRLWKGRNEEHIIRIALIALNIVAMLTFLTVGNKAKAFVPYQSIFSDNYEMGITRRGI